MAMALSSMTQYAAWSSAWPHHARGQRRAQVGPREARRGPGNLGRESVGVGLALEVSFGDGHQVLCERPSLVGADVGCPPHRLARRHDAH
eukprot:3122838-Rhodomonas_salina.3